MGKYKIVRMYADESLPTKTIRRGLSLQEAKKHCNDPETLSRTCTLPSNVAHTERFGPWFDGFDDDK